MFSGFGAVKASVNWNELRSQFECLKLIGIHREMLKLDHDGIQSQKANDHDHKFSWISRV
ncbi:MAG: hypothetical protein CMO80_10285 [Verrucomicrobiales bacterium]|nr:hypothetical protein [Verrucomicrobiales bacterium]